MKMQRFLSILCSVSQIHPQYEPGKTSNEVNTLLLIYEVSHICKVKRDFFLQKKSDGEKTN